MENFQQQNVNNNNQPQPAGGQGKAPAEGQWHQYNVPYNNSYPYTGQGYGYYYPPQQKPKKKINTGLLVFIIVVACVLVFGFGIMVSSITRTATKSGENTEPGTNVSDEIDSLDENALKPGVDKGKNDLRISFSKRPTKELTATQIAQGSKNSVLGISVYSTDGMLEGEASGVVAGVNSDNTKTFIITCAHVVTDSLDSVFKIVDKSGKEYLAAIVGYDASCDIAVLSVEKVGFKAVKFADSASVKAGQTVIAIGNPGGSEFFGSVTQGIVSATDRMVVSDDSTVSGIQHDAAINPGSSGGALFDTYGQVVGINYSKIAAEYYESMNFAIPSKTVVEKANKIIAKSLKTKGVKIGIEYYVSASYFDENYKQLVINSVDSKSDLFGNAEKGDFITAVDGKKITDKYTIVEIISQKEAGDEITLTIAHKNENTSEYETKDVVVKLLEKQ